MNRPKTSDNDDKRKRRKSRRHRAVGQKDDKKRRFNSKTMANAERCVVAIYFVAREPRARRHWRPLHLVQPTRNEFVAASMLVVSRLPRVISAFAA